MCELEHPSPVQKMPIRFIRDSNWCEVWVWARLNINNLSPYVCWNKIQPLKQTEARMENKFKMLYWEPSMNFNHFAACNMMDVKRILYNREFKNSSSVLLPVNWEVSLPEELWPPIQATDCKAHWTLVHLRQTGIWGKTGYVLSNTCSSLRTNKMYRCATGYVQKEKMKTNKQTKYK